MVAGGGLVERWRSPSPARGALLVVVLLLPVYLLTITSPDQVNLDAEVAALPAWHLVEHGTIDLRDVPTDNPFVTDGVDGRRLGDRPLLLSLLAVPAYWITNDATYSVRPATATALVLTLAAMGVMYLVMRRVLPHPWAFGATLALALGTATWPISAAELWPHGPGQLCLALALLAAAARRPAWSGITFALAFLIRPVTAVMPAIVGALQASRTRWRVAAQVVGFVAVAAAVLAVYNSAMFGGGLNITGGYGPGFRGNLTGQSAGGYLATLGDTLISGRNGLLVWSPVLLVGAGGLWWSWTTVPSWARDGAVAGAGYLLLHARLNRASGGLPFDYRYPLEAITMAAPALALGARAAYRRGAWARRLLLLTLGVSVMLQGIVALRYECDQKPGVREGTCSIA